MVLGYKGFNNNMTCRGFQYEVGQTYEYDGNIGLCESGFHFCRKMADVLNYYSGRNCHYAEVEALGEVIDGKDKSVTDRIRIVRKLTWAEVLKVMYTQSDLNLEASFFPADEVIRARKNGTLDELLPSGTEFPVRFSNGEWNVLVVCRDRDHTYLVTKYVMAEPFAMNEDETSKGGWPASRMRKHVREIYNMLPKEFKKAVIPIRIKCNNMAFLLGPINVFGEYAWHLNGDYDDSKVDILQNPTARIKGRLGASSASQWWLRTANCSNNFFSVNIDGSVTYTIADAEGGVVVGFCIETRGSLSDRIVRTIRGFLRRLFREYTWIPERDCGNS